MNKPSNPKAEIKIEDGPRQLSCYANLCRITFTPEEAILHFGERKDVDHLKGVGNAKIYLSLPHAKRLANAMLKTIKSYEKNFGEISEQPLDHLTLEGQQSLGLRPKDEKNE